MFEIVDEKEVRDILEVKQVDNKKVENEVVDTLPLIPVTTLPSGFKGYPQGTKISYNPITLGELEALNNGTEEDIERGIAMLLNAIHCNTLSSSDLYYWDVIYIGIQRKLLAFGDTKGVLYAQCPKCGGIVEKEFDYTEIEFKEIQAPDLPVITDIAGKKVEFGLLTMKDFLEVDIEKGELDVYARMIKNLPYEEAYKLISNSYGKDTKKIRYIDKILNYGLKPFFETCNNEIVNPDFNSEKKESKSNPKMKLCQEEVRVEVRSPFEVVFPENNDDGHNDFEIQYGRS